MTPTWFVVPAAVVILGVAGFSPTPSAAAAPVPAFEGQQYGWDIPPQEYNEVQRRGFHDGVQGAQKDYGNGRRANVNNRDEYRDPDDMPHDIPPQLRDAYRYAFRRGYALAASHLWGPQAPPPQPNWDTWGMRGLQTDAERRGYHIGVAEARNDFEAHNPPDPDGHRTFMNPPVPPELFEEYRRGYMRGYTVAMSQLSGEPSWEQYRGDPATWQAPSAYTEWKRRGFRDGIDGARKDYANGRRPTPNNRDEYRDPQVPGQFRQDYRLGFRRGYELAASHLYGGM
jgi:hypothetical protein